MFTSTEATQHATTLMPLKIVRPIESPCSLKSSLNWLQQREEHREVVGVKRKMISSRHQKPWGLDRWPPILNLSLSRIIKVYIWSLITSRKTIVSSSIYDLVIIIITKFVGDFSAIKTISVTVFVWVILKEFSYLCNALFPKAS